MPKRDDESPKRSALDFFCAFCRFSKMLMISCRGWSFGNRHANNVKHATKPPIRMATPMKYSSKYVKKRKVFCHHTVGEAVDVGVGEGVASSSVAAAWDSNTRDTAQVSTRVSCISEANKETAERPYGDTVYAWKNAFGRNTGG